MDSGPHRPHTRTGVPRRVPAAAAVLASIVVALLAPSVGAAPRSPEACPAESQTDLWDQSRGATITDDTGFLEIGPGPNVFGADFPGPEKGNAFFRDDKPDGFVHRVAWTTSSPVQVRSFVLRAGHGHNDLRRAFSSFTLLGKAPDGSLTVLYRFSPPIPYGHGSFGNVLVLCDDIDSGLVTSDFVAEFVQVGTCQYCGPRIYELDGSDVALPSVATAIASPSPTTTGVAGGETTLIIWIGLLALLAAFAIGILIGRRRRRGADPKQ